MANENTVCQRWRLGRDHYRPAGEVIDTSSFEVAEIKSDNVARAFVEDHHYSQSYPAARFRYGLYAKRPAPPRAWALGERYERELVGVAVYSHPTNALALAPLPGLAPERLEAILQELAVARKAGDKKRVAELEEEKRDPRVELGRFVLLDHVGANAETWFLARTFELLRKEDLVGVVSFSDPFPRTTADGRVVFGGHLGTIYQAHNAVYLGQMRMDTARFLPDGKTFHNRAIAKLRQRECGWRYVVDMLVGYGAAPPDSYADLAAWTDLWVARLTRKVRRPGNHKYVWAFDRAARRALPSSQPYPKQLREAA